LVASVNVRELHEHMINLILDGNGDDRVLVRVHTGDPAAEAVMDSADWLVAEVFPAGAGDDFVVLTARRADDTR
jgi:hypothetical protein